MRDSESNLPVFLTPVEVAELLRLNVETLRDWRNEDYGPPFVRLGERKVRYRRSDVEAWLSANTGGGIVR